MSSSRRWASAEAAYHRHPDEDYDPDHNPCEECFGQGHEVDEDTGSMHRCSSCKGTGQISDEKLEQEYEDNKEQAEQQRNEE